MLKPIHKADLHIHTIFSDGTAAVPELLDHVARCTDLAVIAITDHDSIEGAQLAQRLAPEYGVDVVIGEEVTTTDGHLLALFIESRIPPGLTAAATIAAIHRPPWLCIAAHPFDSAVPSLGQRDLRTCCTRVRHGTWPLDGVEAFNASIAWPRRHANAEAQRFATERRLPAVGGSDAHSLATIGRGYTLFRGSTAHDLRRALERDEVAWGGHGWTVRDYVEIAWLYARQRSLHGALKLLASDGAVPLQR